MKNSTTFRINRKSYLNITTLVDVKSTNISSVINELLVEWCSNESKRLSIEAPGLYVEYLTKIGESELLEEYKKTTFYKKYIGLD